MTAPELLTAKQVAALLGVTRQRVDQLMADGRIPFVRYGNERLVQAEDARRVWEERRARVGAR
jgi:excisionase family DNA binding protein